MVSLPPLRNVIARHGIAAQRRLGQNFLLDLNLTRRIARAAGPLAEATIIEVGAGPGGLTRALLAEGAQRVVAIERDPRCLAALGELAAVYPGRLEIVAGDALDLDLVALAPAPRKIVANLPYNIATLLLLGWLDRITAFQSLTLMFQREVALRLTAMPRTKSYGRLSVLDSVARRAAHSVRRSGARLCPAAQSDVERRGDCAPPEAASPRRQAAARTRHRRRVRPAPQDAALEPQKRSACR